MSSNPDTFTRKPTENDNLAPEDFLPVTDAAGSKRNPIKGLIQIAAIVAIVAGALYLSRAPSEAEVTARAGAPFAGRGSATVAPPVNVVTLKPATTTLTVNATGTVTVRGYVSLTPQVSGRVVTVAPALREGGEFAAGEILLTIEPRDFELALDQAQADLASAESALMLARAEGEVAVNNYRLLHPTGTVPTLVAKVPQIKQADAQLAAARARVNVAELELSRASYSLPFAGFITSSTAEPGQVLTRGQAFGQAFAEDAIEVAVPLAPADIKLLSPLPGRNASVHANGTTYTAIVERIAPELDQRTRFRRVLLRLTNGRLPPGTFTDVSIEGPAVANTLLLPDASEQTRGVVWVVENGRLRERSPLILSRTKAGLVAESFATGDGVVVGSVPGASDGLEVQPRAIVQ